MAPGMSLSRKLRASVTGAGLAILSLGMAETGSAFTDSTGFDVVNDIGGVDPSAIGLSGLKVDEPRIRANRKACPENFDGVENACNGLRALDALMPSDRKTSPKLADPRQPDQRLP